MSIDENHWTHQCGCRLIKEGNRWIIEKFCEGHTPNQKKRVEKILRRRNRKRGRGYTKSAKNKTIK